MEVAARYGRTEALGDTDPVWVDELETRRNELAAGASLYLHQHRFKVQGGWGTTFGDATSPVLGEQ